MKFNLALTLFILQMSIVALASQQKEFKFKFTYEGQRLEIIETSPSWEKSYEKAAMKCFKHFSKGEKLPQDKGLDLIDLCANPKS